MEKIYKIVLAVFLIGLAPLCANAANLYFSEPANSYTVGDSFEVNIYADSSDQAMNAASGVISFPQDKLEFISHSKTGSIFSIWPREPLYSNSTNSIKFEGLLLNPGFTGLNGKILTVTIKAKAVGTANISFSSASILANDGNGTDILSSSRSTVINIIPESPSTPDTTPVVFPGTALDPLSSVPNIQEPTNPSEFNPTAQPIFTHVVPDLTELFPTKVEPAQEIFLDTPTDQIEINQNKNITTPIIITKKNTTIALNNIIKILSKPYPNIENSKIVKNVSKFIADYLPATINFLVVLRSIFR